MIGIYKYENKINGHVYIGQSVNIKKRQDGHRFSAYHETTSDYNSQFHQAIRKYGLENFSFEILEELKPEEYSRELLNSLEQYYVSKYDSYKNGYNATPGGDANGDDNIFKGEANGRALLTENDVKYIRECYNAHIPFKQVYSEFENKISKRGFQNVWWFKTWPDIYPEYHSEENRYWHSHVAKANASEVAANNKRSFTEEEVIEARRKFYEEDWTIADIRNKFYPNKAKSTVYNMIMGITYKDIPIN